jgi:cytochrome P450
MLPASKLTDNSFDARAIALVGGLVLLPLLSRLVLQAWVGSNEETGWKGHRPESTLPLLGNTLDLLRHGRRGDMHHFHTQLGKQFNAEPVIIRGMGLPPTILFFTPRAYEEVLKTEFDNFIKGPLMCDNVKDLLGSGIFATNGDQWLHQRKTASNLFTSRALRESMTAIIQRQAAVLYAILQRSSDKKRPVDLFKLFNRFTIEAFAEIGFGVRMGCLDSDNEHPFQKAFDSAQRVLVLRFSRPRWFWKAQRWLGAGVEGQLKRDIEVIDTTVLDLVNQALATRSSRGGVKNDYKREKDIVSLFLDSCRNEAAFDPKQLRDIIVNFLIAGRDTTAQALSWFFLELSQNPHAETAIRSEITEKLSGGGVDPANPTMQDVSQLVYLEAALKEALRLHPSVPVEPKYAVQDTTLSDGTFIPAGSAICLATYAMARMTQVWGPDAEEFKPERWIDTATGKLLTVSTFKFASFNAGPRMCLGINLAMLEMKLVVVGVLTRFHLEVLKPADVTYDLSLTLPVRGALNVKVSRTHWPAHA